MTANNKKSTYTWVKMSEATNQEAFICVPDHHKGALYPLPSTPPIDPFPQQKK